MNRIRRTAGFLVLLPLLCNAGSVRAERQVDGPLAEYVAKPDASFRWEPRRHGALSKGTFAELILTSQVWRDIVWKHQLFIIKPSSCPGDATHALLFVTGGRWKEELEQEPTDENLPREVTLFATLAEQFATPVAVLLQVPHQPIFDGKYEDAIIAFTFDQYFETGDAGWPLLLPMVKSAVRGMDAVQQFSKQQWSLDIQTFSVSGASKRGWTAWLTGAVEPRAVAIAPMVIDVLNMAQHMKHQKDVWGEFSHQIDDYTQRGLQDKMDTPRGESLRRIVDPYYYRHVLTQPKLIMIGTNDPYWPLDALNLYWDDLVGEKYILYVPNNGHSLQDLGRVAGGLNALIQRAASGKELPKFSWRFTPSADRGTVSLTVRSDVRPSKVQFWVATSKSRDFRDAQWKSHERSAAKDGRYIYDLNVPTEGFAALFGEALYSGLSLPLYLSTNVSIMNADQGIVRPERK